MKAKVYVTLRKSVLDPQGEVIKNALHHMNFNQVQNVRMGKMIELSFDPKTDKATAEKNLKAMCENLLANTVIEDYRWEIQS